MSGPGASVWRRRRMTGANDVKLKPRLHRLRQKKPRWRNTPNFSCHTFCGSSSLPLLYEKPGKPVTYLLWDSARGNFLCKRRASLCKCFVTSVSHIIALAPATASVSVFDQWLCLQRSSIRIQRPAGFPHELKPQRWRLRRSC